MYIKWALITLKRNICSVSFWVLALLMVVLIYSLGFAFDKGSENMTVLLYSENSEAGEEIIEYLTKQEDMGYSFAAVDSVEDIRTSVIRNEACCGYVFTEGLDEAIHAQKYNEEIICIASADSMEAYITGEIVYTAVLDKFGDSIFKAYLEGEALEAETAGYAVDRYLDIKSDRNFGIYEVKTVDTGTDNKTQESIAVLTWSLIFICSLMRSFLERHRLQNLYKALDVYKKCLFSIQVLLTELVLYGIIGMVFDLIRG